MCGLFLGGEPESGARRRLGKRRRRRRQWPVGVGAARVAIEQCAAEKEAEAVDRSQVNEHAAAASVSRL
jgi:hypothetical protein